MKRLEPRLLRIKKQGVSTLIEENKEREEQRERGKSRSEQRLSSETNYH